MHIGKVRLSRPKMQEPIAKIVGSTHGEVALAGCRCIGPVGTNQITRLVPKVFLITSQAKRNLSSRSGIGGVLSAT